MVRHQWGYLDIQVCAKFRSKYSLILYEMMSTLVRRKHRRDSWPVEELRNWLGVDRPEHPDVVTAENPEKLQGWNPFYKRALKPALEEVNRLAAFTVTRSEEHTSELQSLMRTSYAVFCLQQNKK